MKLLRLCLAAIALLALPMFLEYYIFATQEDTIMARHAYFLPLLGSGAIMVVAAVAYFITGESHED